MCLLMILNHDADGGFSPGTRAAPNLRYKFLEAERETQYQSQTIGKERVHSRWTNTEKEINPSGFGKKSQRLSMF